MVHEACGTASITERGGHASKLEAWRSPHHLQAVLEVKYASLLGFHTEGKEETLYSLKYSTLFIHLLLIFLLFPLIIYIYMYVYTYIHK